MGRRAVPALVDCVRRPDAKARAECLLAIGLIAQRTKPGVPLTPEWRKAAPAEWVNDLRPLWLELLGDSEPKIRRRAAGSLLYCWPDEAPEVAALLRREEKPNQRTYLGSMLIKCGRRDLVPEAVIEELEELKKGPWRFDH
jgi:hypothetical protein